MFSSLIKSPRSTLTPNIAWRRWLDTGEKLVLLTFYTFFLLPILDAVVTRGDAGAILLAIAETLVVALVLFRKPAQVLSMRPLDWALAFGATIAPTLVRPVAASPGWLTNAAAVCMLLGICFQIYAKFTLGRRFGIVAANRGICCKGPYRIVRHPIYMGYLMTHIGFITLAFSPWNLLVYIVAYSLLIPRIFAEERLLRRDPQYEAYCGRTRWRLLPGVL
jgi:protein-S-isoprenylcysteine O-methyltransferase Ste14